MAYEYYDLRTRHIVIKFILDSEVFGEGTDRDGNPLNVKIIRGDSTNNTLTIDCEINKSTGFTQSNASVTINGMSINDINTLSLTQMYPGVAIGKNVIEIYAGYNLNSNGFPPLAYRGQIYSAYPDFNNPNRSRPFKVISLYGIQSQNGETTGNVSIEGEIPLETLFKRVASQFKGLQFVGNNLFGYTAINPRYEGSPEQQMDMLCADYGYHWKADDTTILVAPINQPFYPDEVIVISKDNNMIGYPQWIPFGLQVIVRYTPLIKYGQVVKIISDMPYANNNNWYINGIAHKLTNKNKLFASVLQLNTVPFGGN